MSEAAPFDWAKYRAQQREFERKPWNITARLYALSDTLKAAEAEMEALLAADLMPPDRLAQFAAIVNTGRLDIYAACRAIIAMADEWQGALDAESEGGRASGGVA